MGFMSEPKRRIFRSTDDLEPADIRSLYNGFQSPIATLDCGRKCAPHNPSGKPFCCDICQAVPAAYQSEWSYLAGNTGLWHQWRGDECAETKPKAVSRLKGETPSNMILLACLGPSECQRNFRALSCRQFPFFPYVTSDYRFIGLAYQWQFEQKCWVISNLHSVTDTYKQEFVRTYDGLFALFQEEFEQYAYHSELMRAEFTRRRKRFPLLHRNGGCYLVGPRNERLNPMRPDRLARFGVYL